MGLLVRRSAMRNLSFAIVVFVIISCSSRKKLIDKNAYNLEWNIEEVNIISAAGSTKINELRFHEVNSAKDAMILMFQNYGKWDKKAEGKYQDNIKQLVWENLNVLNDGHMFTVITDGTETESNYFASLVIFDSDGKDCLRWGSPLRDELTNLFLEKMKTLEIRSGVYSLLEN